jgi:colicin import membrane protein
MAEQKATPRVGLDQQLAAARRNAAEKRQAVDGLAAQLRTAVAEQRYADAEALKQELPDAEHEWVVAHAEAQALEGALAHLALERQQRDAAEQAERRKQQAIGHLNAAAERERELMDELASVRAELTAGVAAVQETIRRGYELESAVRQARTAQAQARIDAGDAVGMPHVSAPNVVSAVVERSQALLAIVRGEALPG